MSKQRVVNFLGGEVSKIMFAKESFAKVKELLESATIELKNQIYYMLVAQSSSPDRTSTYCARAHSEVVTDIGKSITKHLQVKQSDEKRHKFLSRSLRLVGSIEKFAKKHSLVDLDSGLKLDIAAGMKTCLADASMVPMYADEFFKLFIQCLQVMSEDQKIAKDMVSTSLGFYLDMRAMSVFLMEVLSGDKTNANAVN
jgi:hypothetical protein